MKKLILFLLLTIKVNSFGQQEPQPQKVDEFQNPNCEEISARLDNFGIQMANDPNSVGLVAINGQRSSLRKNLVIERMIKTYFEKRVPVPERLTIIRSSDADELTVRFWIIPLGSKVPDVTIGEWSYKVDKAFKPAMFAWAKDDDGICPEIDTLQILADVLAVNPKAHTNVVVRVSSTRAYLRKLRKISDELMSKYKISKNQIRFFKAAEPNYRTIIWDEEYWLLP